MAAGQARPPALDWVQVDGQWCQVVPGPVHELLCRWPIAAAAGDLVDCEACGLLYPASERGAQLIAEPGAQPPTPPSARHRGPSDPDTRRRPRR